MAKLAQIKPPVAPLSPKIGFLADDPAASRRFWRQDRAFYGTARWQRLRWLILQRDLFTCRRCGKVEADTSKLVADHVQPAQLRPDLIWEASNLQCLCDGCHSGAKQAEEAAGRAGGGGVGSRDRSDP